MSSINTGAINPNYPVPGVNNSTQGFRDNFQSIKNNLDIAGAEISELQTKSILKSALSGVTLDNNMANTLISNAAVRGFRATTYNLGNNLGGSVNILVNNGDVQYGTVTSSIAIGFQNWAPAGTQSNVQLVLNIANTNATIIFPTNVTDGATTLENYTGNGTGGQVTVPANVTVLHYNFSTLNCGNNIEVQPLNRPRHGGGGSTVVTPSGPNGSVQFNNAGNLAGVSELSFTQGNSLLTTANLRVTGRLLGDLIPATDLGSNLGSPTQRFRELYLAGNSVYLGNQTISTSVANGVTGVRMSNVITTNFITSNLLVNDLAELGYASEVRILGGESGQFLSTDGAGHLSWADLSYSSIPAVYFAAPFAGNNQTFSNNFLFSYESNTDMTVFRNGVLIENTNYTLSGDTLTVNVTLAADDQIQVVRALAANVVSAIVNVPTIYFTATTTGNNQTFSNSYISSYSSPDEMSVFLNGALLGNGFYSVNETNLTISTEIQTGDSITVLRQYAANILAPSFSAAGSNTQVQYNKNSILSGNSAMTFNETTGVFSANTVQGRLRLVNTAPANAASAGTAGDMAYDGGYLYICVANNVWKRTAINTW